MKAQTTTSSEQQFYIEAIDLPYYKITLARSRSYALDLNNANSSTGTTVCTWQYSADTDTPTHRQWMLCSLTALGEDTGIDELAIQPSSHLDAIYDLQGRKVTLPTKGLYIVNGQKVMMK